MAWRGLIITVIIISTELLALCDGCLGWGWVWGAGLVAGLRVGQAFGMFLLPGFGVGSSSPWVPGQPNSTSGVNLCYSWVDQWDRGSTPSLWILSKEGNIFQIIVILINGLVTWIKCK